MLISIWDNELLPNRLQRVLHAAPRIYFTILAAAVNAVNDKEARKDSTGCKGEVVVTTAQIVDEVSFSFLSQESLLISSAHI